METPSKNAPGNPLPRTSCLGADRLRGFDLDCVAEFSNLLGQFLEAAFGGYRCHGLASFFIGDPFVQDLPYDHAHVPHHCPIALA